MLHSEAALIYPQLQGTELGEEIKGALPLEPGRKHGVHVFGDFAEAEIAYFTYQPK